MNQSINVELTGVSALMMNAYPLIEVEALEKKPVEIQAEHAAYRVPETGELYVPGVNLQRAMVAAAAYSKGKGRASLQKPAAACLMVSEEYLLIDSAFGTKWVPLKTYKVDTRPVVIPATKGRVLRHRPRIDKWRIQFTLTYDDTLLSAKQVRQIVDDTGKNVGVLDFRPEKKGPFGRFIVTSWKEDQIAA